MKRTLRITESNPIEIAIEKDNDKRTWYFVNWNMGEKDEMDNFVIYTYNSTFGERIPIFKSKDWKVTCEVGNLINGMFHKYFEISNSYPIIPALNIGDLCIYKTQNPSLWKKLKAYFYNALKCKTVQQ